MTSATGPQATPAARPPATDILDGGAVDARVEALLAQMTLEEKIGQLTQVSGQQTLTGPLNLAAADQDGLRSGRVGSMLNVLGVRYTRGYQEEALHSRLKIPLLFAHDVIHGLSLIHISEPTRPY